MTDVHDKATRSYNMSQIKSKDTTPEIIVRKYLFSHGYRYRINYPKLKGKPDIVLPKYKTVIFINGCFWHGHNNCKYFVIPKTRTEWWIEKITNNVKRDEKNHKFLKDSGWEVIVIWGCQLRTDKRVQTLNSLLDKLRDK